VDSLARSELENPVEITVGGRSAVAPEVTQIVEVRAETTKYMRLKAYLQEQINRHNLYSSLQHLTLPTQLPLLLVLARTTSRSEALWSLLVSGTLSISSSLQARNLER